MGFTYTSGTPSGGTITGMQDSYFGMPQITLQQLNIPVSVLNAFVGAHDNAGAQAALFAGDDVITGGPLEDLFRGYVGNDAISTGAGADTLDGGVGADTLDGGAGGDVIITGGGADVIVIGQGQSAGGQADVVTDWSSSDAIQFAHPAGDSTAYVEATAPDLASAAAQANQLIGSGSANIVAVAVGSDVVIYADSGADNGVADDVVILSGRTLADVSYTNFGMTAPVTPPVTPPTGTDGNDALQGSAAADTLNGGLGNDTIDGAGGGDTIITGGGADVIVIGQGQSTPSWAQSDVVSDWSANDTVRFAHVSGDATTYAERTAADYGAAMNTARDLISTGTVNVVAVAIGNDVAVYADTADDNGVADDVVILTGRTLADVSAGNFGLTGGATPPVGVPPPAAPTGLMLDAASDSGVKGDGITNVAQFRMTGVAEKGASISLYDGTQLVGTGQADAATGAFSVAASSPLADGAHTLSAVAGNSGGASVYSASVNVTLDTHAGVVDFDGFSETAVGKKLNVTLHGTASDVTSSVASVNVLQDGVSIGSVTPVNGAWSVSKTSVSDAVHTYTLQTTDAAGNVGAGSSTLILGSSGADKIVGKATNDVIHGDAGADTLTGGAGADVFVYDALDDAALGRTKTSPLDTITDFQSGADKLDLSDLGHMTFKGQSATIGAHEVSWYVSSGDTFVTGDVTGDGKADFIIQLKGVLALSGSDFLLS